MNSPAGVVGQLDDSQVGVRRGAACRGHQITPRSLRSARSSADRPRMLAEHVVVVLAEQRRRAPVVLRRRRHRDRHALEPRRADHRVVELEEQAAVGELRVDLVEVLGVLRHRGADAVACSRSIDVVRFEGLGPRREVGVEVVLVGEAAGLGGEARVGGPRRVAERGHERLPLGLVEHGDGEPAVVAGAAVDPVRGGVGVLEAVAGREVRPPRGRPLTVTSSRIGPSRLMPASTADTSISQPSPVRLRSRIAISSAAEL